MPAVDFCPQTIWRKFKVFQTSSASGVIATRGRADKNDMGRRVASIVSGIIVALLTGTVAWSFLMAATWSGIHGGMSGMMLAVLSLVAMAVPPGCGFLVGHAVYRARWPRRGTRQRTEPIRLNCPRCGCSMKRSAAHQAASLTVAECPICGPFHFGTNADLTVGPPPSSTR